VRHSVTSTGETLGPLPYRQGVLSREHLSDPLRRLSSALASAGGYSGGMQREHQPGISALLVANDDMDRAVLDLAAVLDGLTPKRFEIIVVGEAAASLSDLRARSPGLPIRCADADADPRYELIFVAARDGQFDIRELNHLLEAIERGAEVAAGYRPRRTDAIVRCLQRWGCNVDVDCAFALLRRAVWQRLMRPAHQGDLCVELSNRARRLGYGVAEVAVSQRRPSIGVAVTAGTRAA
jgi:hypothetical protein